MEAVITCLSQQHDRNLLLAACAICVIGVYASFALSKHAGRSEGAAKARWAVVSIVAAGCTAWATHMVALLAYRPGMPAAFDLALAALSLVTVILGIGLSMSRVIGTRDARRRFVAGAMLGLSIAILHYLGQFSYRVMGTVAWDPGLALGSVGIGLLLSGAAMVVAGRNRCLRRFAPPLLLGSIAVIHAGGMTAMSLTYNPWVALPAFSVAPKVIAPIVAGVCLGLIALAVLGLRFTLKAQAQLRRDRARLSELSNLAVEGLVVCDGNTIVIVNDSFARMAGAEKGALIGERIGALIPRARLAEMVEREEYDAELVAPGGKLIPVRVLRSEVRVGARDQVVYAFRDQRERLKSEATIRRLAYSDPLTGLTNRARFLEALASRAAAHGPDAGRFAILAIDLDRFKRINDTFGHRNGDEVLRQVAGRLRAMAGEDDVVARLAGDEFTVLTGMGRGDPAGIATGVLRAMEAPFAIGGQTVEITASIGVAVATGNAADADTLVLSADLALSRAKLAGGARICPYEPEMLVHALDRGELERDLRRAVTEGGFEVHFQPLACARTGSFDGAEALARWNHPRRGMISPAIFIPLAEEIGLIGAIGAQVLRQACIEAAGWPEATSLAVNLSPVQLGDPHLVRDITGILDEAGFPARRLELEITESALLHDDARTFGNLRDLQRLGIRIALDDFGTGYSSLSHLRRFPFDKVKIDQSFVRQIPEDPTSVAIVQAIVALAGRMRMRVTIEGVETPRQDAFARREGCDQIQGYLISRPLPTAELAAFRALEAGEAAAAKRSA